MSATTTFINSLTGLAAVFLFVIGAVYAVAQLKNGRSKANADAITAAQNTIDILQRQNSVLTQEVTILGKDLARLQGETKQKDEHHRQELAAKDAEIERYVKIFQGRGPDQEEFMKLMTNTATATMEYMKTTTEILKRLESKLDAKLPME